jgi:AAA15 family ATPase/GTPase
MEQPSPADSPAPDTSNHLDWVDIKNFKSIKDLHLDCKRVNIFIGKPNVGKSNILEALGMLGADYSIGKFMENFARYDDLKYFFYDIDTANEIIVRTGTYNLYLKKSTKSILQDDYLFRFKSEQDSFDGSRSYYMLNSKGDHIKSLDPQVLDKQYPPSSIKKYDYKNDEMINFSFSDFLLPPNGKNLYEIVNRNPLIWEEFAKLFSEQGLEFVLSTADQRFLLQKKIGPRAYQFPYYAIADTFRRYIFYIAAIESNKDSVLIFEEPEVHSFPPYTQDVAYRMIYSETNQFFVSTHSPYLLQTLVENLSDEQVQVFVTYYENYETKAKALSPDELAFVQEYSTDIFFNLDRFIPNAQSAPVA